MERLTNKEYKKQWYLKNRDRILSKNKEERKKYAKRYRKENPDKVKIYNKAYKENNKEDISIYNKEYRKTNKEKINKLLRKYRNSPIGKFKIRARLAVFNAIKSGDLIKLPCEVCGEKKSEGHHEDYNKPLEVIWLCREHHIELHKELNKE